jgi:hypothetical protein
LFLKGVLKNDFSGIGYITNSRNRDYDCLRTFLTDQTEEKKEEGLK